MIMKKTISIVLCLMMIICIAAGCGKGGTADAPRSEKLSIVTTIFPEYDWVRQILGEKAADADVTLLLDNGVDLHSYQPTADDILTIANCDLFIYVGGESDEWVEETLATAENKNMVTINLLEALGDAVKDEEIVEGMEAEHEEEAEGHEEEEGPEKDEHVWLSLRNAAALCRVIADKLGEIDGADKDVYTANANAYIEKLNALDGQYQDAAASAKTKTLLFADRFPFRYLTDDYGLDYYAAFVGCSAESEASFETITFLAGKADELGLSTILQIESADGKIAQTVKNTTKAKNQTILTMDSMQSATTTDIENGVTYLSVMEKNLDVLKTALQ